KAESWNETLRFKDAAFEFFFLGLRKIRGVELGEFERRFGMSADSVYPSLISMLVQRRLAKRRGSRFALSSRGLLLSDSVIEHFAEPERHPDSLPDPEGGEAPLRAGND